MPDPASITLSRDGISVTVNVGDVVPMTDGTKAKVKTIDSTNVPIEIVTSSGPLWYCQDGKCYGMEAKRPAIDIAALAAPARAAPAVPVERVLALAKEWRDGAAGMLRSGRSARNKGYALACETHAALLEGCATALEALAKEAGNG